MIRQRFLMALLASITTLSGTLNPSAAVSALELVTPIAEYKIYVAQKVRWLVTETRAFTAAVKSGNLERAKALYQTTRISYGRIEPIA